MKFEETLKALELTEEIVVDEPKLRVLESTKPQFLKRSISQLDRAMNEEAERISQLLKLEAEATANAAKAHPATVALNRAVKNLQGQAVVTVVSNNGEDPDALAVTLEKLTDRGFGVVSVGAKRNLKVKNTLRWDGTDPRHTLAVPDFLLALIFNMLKLISRLVKYGIFTFRWCLVG